MDAVVQAAAVAVDVTNFITASDASSQAFKTATLLKTLNINSLITGESGVGKKTLAKYILPDAHIVDASNYDELLSSVESCKEIIITNLEKSPNIKKTFEAIASNSLRVIATASQNYKNELIDEYFSLIFTVPPLSERVEDVQFLIEKFIGDAQVLFDSHEAFDFSEVTPDLSKNAHSLKRQVMIHYLLSDIHDIELMQIIESYLSKKLGSNNDYKNFLYLYEVPLIKAGLTKFKSQLQLADRLGLNRNTLRKKIADNKEYL